MCIRDRQYSGQLGKKYNAFGESAFDISNTNASYTKNLKKQVVLDYLNGGGSYDDLAIKYCIPSSSPCLLYTSRCV